MWEGEERWATRLRVRLPRGAPLLPPPMPFLCCPHRPSSMREVALVEMPILPSCSAAGGEVRPAVHLQLLHKVLQPAAAAVVVLVLVPQRQPRRLTVS